MSLHRAAFAEMLRCTLLGHLRNRLALLLAVVFIPAWIAVARLCAPDRPLRFALDAAGTDALARASHVSEVANALAAVTLVTGFVMFMETFKAGELDRRLLLAGYPRVPMLLAKVAAVALIAALLALYTTALLWFALPVRQLGPLALAVLGAGLAYGGIGLLLGSLVRGELEGFFLVIMLSLVDTGLQNPVLNVADLPGLAALPLYGANQLALAAAFTSLAPWSQGLLSLAWSAGAGSLALLVFHARTRSHCEAGTDPDTGTAPASGTRLRCSVAGRSGPAR
ncbi:integral membrane protein [Streptomyces ochraceiscleroticus]|uniref:integral membrane protein n=1 Tax=Streptomyces ochraceiscleroticus TaxID=47761 RepID=UPI0004C9ED1E|nr:integral membrane protein [Streptomyces ochraceiscleroticus]